MKNRTLLALIVVLLIVCATQARAEPAPYSYITASASGGSSSHVGTVPGGVTSYTNSLNDSQSVIFTNENFTGRASYSVYSNGGNIPEVGLSLSSSTSTISGNSGANAIANNQWFFMIVPKSGFTSSVATGDPVPINFDYTIDFQGTRVGGGFWDERARIDSDFFDYKIITATDGGSLTNFSRNTTLGHNVETFNVGYNQWHNITISLEGMVVAGGTSASTTFSGFIDPAIIIDQGWLTVHPNDEVIFSAVPPPLVASVPAGWNFISFPTLPALSTPVETVLKDVLPNIRIVWGYDNQTKLWKKWRSEAQDNSLVNIDVGKGYWIFADNPGNIDMSSWAASDNTVHLYEGWNMVGYSGTQDKVVVGSLTLLITDKWSGIWNWANGQWYGKHITTPTLPPPLRPLTRFGQGKAYWIKIKAGAGVADWVQ